MATNPMMQGSMDPMTEAAEPQSFEVCISQMPDGTYMVSKEVKEEPTEPMGEEEMGEHFQSIDEALDAARQMLQGDGADQAAMKKGYIESMADQ